MESVVDAIGRQVTGSAEARRLRRNGKLPAIINLDNGESHLLELKRHSFQLMLHQHASENIIVSLSVDGGKVIKAVVKDVQHDMFSGEILHVDFMEISMTRKMRIMVPLQFVGDAPGVELGGIVEHLLREIEVECFPQDLVEFFDVDISSLNIGDSILVNNLKLGTKFSVITALDIAITHVTAPRVEDDSKSEEGEEAEEGEVHESGAEPEVIGKEGDSDTK